MIGATILIVSGLYNVGASDRHYAVSEALINFALRRSVKTHSAGISVPDLSGRGLAQLGARHYAVGCAPCHGSPIEPGNRVFGQMYPSAPSLQNATHDWDSADLFWIVRHGLKFTGMPAWAGVERDDEVWSLVAFLQVLPEMNEAEFKEFAGIADDASMQGIEGAVATGKDYCDSCHGNTTAEPISNIVPVLHAQHATYLERSLREYRANLRQSGIMEPIAAELSDEAIKSLAGYYADQPLPSGVNHRDGGAYLERGRLIFEEGLRGAGIPACSACHANDRSPSFPRLAGMPQAYLTAQLDLFRTKRRSATSFGQIMSVMAQRLTTEQIADVTAYIATMPTPASAELKGNAE
jgi:cytochrome c553